MTEAARPPTDPRPWPLELRLRAGRQVLHVRFDDGLAADLPAHLLRVFSPSAQVQGHGAGEEAMLVADKRAVRILAVERVGSYAVRLVFDDGHDSGFYTWDFLAGFARTLPARQARYERETAAAR